MQGYPIDSLRHRLNYRANNNLDDLVGYADTDPIPRVDTSNSHRSRRLVRPATPPQWRDRMPVPPKPGDIRLAATTADPAADRPTAPQTIPGVPPADLVAYAPLRTDFYDQCHIQELRRIRQLMVVIVFVLLVGVIASIAIGTAIATDLSDFLNNNGITH